ncbi:hypothetical protein Tco_0523338 [Tanacetum coccineum]
MLTAYCLLLTAYCLLRLLLNALTACCLLLACLLLACLLLACLLLAACCLLIAYCLLLALLVRVVQNLLRCLHSPELPLLQWQECFANEALNGGGKLFVEKLPDVKVHVVHGNKLTATFILNEIPKDIGEVFMTGANSKLGRAIDLKRNLEKHGITSIHNSQLPLLPPICLSHRRIKTQSSVGQVYKGGLKENGDWVTVKVPSWTSTADFEVPLKEADLVENLKIQLQDQAKAAREWEIAAEEQQEAIMSDGSAMISMTCFSDQANSLTKDCNEVLTEIAAKNPYRLPSCLKDLEGGVYY